MKKSVLIQKISLIFALVIFFIIEAISLFVVPSIQSLKVAFFLQVVGLVCTGFLIYINIMEFNVYVESNANANANGWMKFRKLFTYILSFSVLSTFWMLSSFSMDGIANKSSPFVLDNTLNGLILGLMYGRDWRFHMLNGLVWMQGLKSIDWVILSIRGILSVSNT
jgi:hypothetical protein